MDTRHLEHIGPLSRIRVTFFTSAFPFHARYQSRSGHDSHTAPNSTASPNRQHLIFGGCFSLFSFGFLFSDSLFFQPNSQSLETRQCQQRSHALVILSAAPPAVASLRSDETPSRTNKSIKTITENCLSSTKTGFITLGETIVLTHTLSLVPVSSALFDPGATDPCSQRVPARLPCLHDRPFSPAPFLELFASSFLCPTHSKRACLFFYISLCSSSFALFICSFSFSDFYLTKDWPGH